MSTLFALIAEKATSAISLETIKIEDKEDTAARPKDDKAAVVGPMPRVLEARLNGVATSGLAARQFADALLSTGAFADVRVEASERVLLGAWVSQINHGPQGVEVVAENLSVRAQRAIVTLPPTLAGRIRYVPALPAARDHLTESTPMGWVIKVHCVYATRFWRDQNLSGAVTSDKGVVRATADNSPPSGSPAILVGFIEGAAARALAPAPQAQRRAAVLADFTRYFGEQAAHPLAYYEYSWGDDPWSRGAYGGYWTEGLWTAYGPVLRASIGTLHWAGTETSPEWNGKMEGAVRSGERVAQEVLVALG